MAFAIACCVPPPAHLGTLLPQPPGQSAPQRWSASESLARKLRRQRLQGALLGAVSRGVAGESEPEGPAGALVALARPTGELNPSCSVTVASATLRPQSPTEDRRPTEVCRAACSALGAAFSAALPPAPPGVGRGGQRPPVRQWWTEAESAEQTAASRQCSAAGRTARTRTTTPPSSPGAETSTSGLLRPRLDQATLRHAAPGRRDQPLAINSSTIRLCGWSRRTVMARPEWPPLTRLSRTHAHARAR